MLELIMAATALAATATHSETLSYRNSAIDLHYRAHVELHTEAIGLHAPTRGHERACHWQARLIFERRLGDGAFATRLPVVKKANGTLHGPCHDDSRHVQQAAHRALGDLDHALREAARQDRPTVLAEIEAAHPRSTQ
ncbi:hypothetical protein [Novosphingobium humi]|uniref:Uncharacterized protein n=1 Tax=Novosphingobium humi TaxID=2282397 RepID=A0ABY7TXJ1_9SPHN|nr:hypothetical protein [Novosphingobium humi]WCT76539.1 hypothetical protein PQ457_11405 [Novosphingobium humi]WJS99957.1 hypothetical protein NYQ05_07395 [Novosphingobium humi]